MIKKPADELVTRLEESHKWIEGILHNYLDEYSDYGWDSICTELANIAAQIDLVRVELKHSPVSGLYRWEKMGEEMKGLNDEDWTIEKQ